MNIFFLIYGLIKCFIGFKEKFLYLRNKMEIKHTHNMPIWNKK
jgi:hypothetical protein